LVTTYFWRSTGSAETLACCDNEGADVFSIANSESGSPSPVLMRTVSGNPCLGLGIEMPAAKSTSYSSSASINAMENAETPMAARSLCRVGLIGSLKSVTFRYSA
jgi:hypothetical protein